MTFSKVKSVKARLRNSLSEEKAESYMLLSIQKELLGELDAEIMITLSYAVI